MPEYKIAKIKHHVFVDDSHILDLRVGRVDPEIPIAEAWNRLINGNFIPSDIKLLKHEIFESKYEKLFKQTYNTSHKNAEKSGREWNPPQGE